MVALGIGDSFYVINDVHRFSNMNQTSDLYN